LFELLISASGVGPSLALKILSGMSVDDLVPAVRAGDLPRLTRIPGVGRKTAERIIVELRDKLAAEEFPEDARKPVSATGTTGDVVSALLNLGYDQHAAEQAVERAGKKGISETFETLLRSALQELTAPSQNTARAAR
jgi:holliday junction DNA helicase RuvA